MRVALDLNVLYMTEAGTARYLHGIQAGFKQNQTPNLEFEEIAWKVSNYKNGQPWRSLQTLYRELIWNRFVAGGMLSRSRPDLLHTQSYPLLIPPSGMKMVVTLHDLAILRYPHRFRGWHRFSAARDLQKLYLADKVICISEFTAREARELLGLDERKIEVVYNGCDFHDTGPEVGIKTDFVVPSEFLLFVGSLEPGKNLGLLREVYELAARSGNPLPHLLIVGARWSGVAREGHPPENWVYLGRQPDSVVVHLYRRARALAFPSIYEGFGLPVAEAMVLGCPVVCSPVASLPEVAGDAALYCPHEPASYLEALLKILPDTNLRSDMIAKGRERGSKFTWKQCAQGVESVYQSVLG